MRIAIAEFSQETDTFNPIVSDVQSFRASTLLIGQSIFGKPTGSGVLDGACRFFQNKASVELLPVLAAKAVPGGRLKEDARRYFRDQIVEGLRSQLPLDSLLLSLHGATVSEETDDVCGQLLEDVANLLGPSVPVVVPLDHHANVTRRILENSTLVVGHETQPHNPAATGAKAAMHLCDLMRNKPRIAGAWAKIPMIAPQDQFLTSVGPMRRWFEAARKLERTRGVLSISLFPMQPWVDVKEGGWTVVVYTEDNADLAVSIARRLARQAWELRQRFWVSRRVSPAEAVHRAVRAKEGLVILSDTGDAVYGGAPGESTCLVKEMVRQRIPCKAFLPLVDAQAVDRAFELGLGKASLCVGGHFDPFSEPVRLDGRVTALSEGLKLVTDRGMTQTGRTALFEVENVKIVLLAEVGHAINLPILYTHLGLRIEDARMVVLKTGSNFQYFEPWRKKLLRVDTPGTTQSDLSALSWRSLPRPIYPLDPILEWEAKATVIR